MIERHSQAPDRPARCADSRTRAKVSRASSSPPNASVGPAVIRTKGLDGRASGHVGQAHGVRWVVAFGGAARRPQRLDDSAG
jgi:hypothetical protein